MLLLVVSGFRCLPQRDAQGYCLEKLKLERNGFDPLCSLFWGGGFRVDFCWRLDGGVEGCRVSVVDTPSCPGRRKVNNLMLGQGNKN